MALLEAIPWRLAAVGMFAPLLPLIAVQARQVRRAMPHLPDAHGPTAGVFGKPPPRLRIVVVGESTVSGVGARTHTHSLAGRLGAALGAGFGVSVSWKAVGRSGANARSAARLVHESLKPATGTARGERFDCAFLALGVNDVIERTPLVRWKTDVAALADLLATRHGARAVVLLGVPPMHTFPALPQPLRAFLGARARELDEVLESLAGRTSHVLHVPAPVNGPLEYFCADRFHPSEAGYAAWASYTVNAVAGTLAERLGTPLVGRTQRAGARAADAAAAQEDGKAGKARKAGKAGVSGNRRAVRHGGGNGARAGLPRAASVRNGKPRSGTPRARRREGGMRAAMR